MPNYLVFKSFKLEMSTFIISMLVIGNFENRIQGLNKVKITFSSKNMALLEGKSLWT